jgi:hypothetical protein
VHKSVWLGIALWKSSLDNQKHILPGLQWVPFPLTQAILFTRSSGTSEKQVGSSHVVIQEHGRWRPANMSPKCKAQEHALGEHMEKQHTIVGAKNAQIPIRPPPMAVALV